MNVRQSIQAWERLQEQVDPHQETWDWLRYPPELMGRYLMQDQEEQEYPAQYWVEKLGTTSDPKEAAQLIQAWLLHKVETDRENLRTLDDREAENPGSYLAEFRRNN